jgi:hypothetical protein
MKVYRMKKERTPLILPVWHLKKLAGHLFVSIYLLPTPFPDLFIALSIRNFHLSIADLATRELGDSSILLITMSTSDCQELRTT